MMPDGNNIAFLSGLVPRCPSNIALISRAALENLATESARKIPDSALISAQCCFSSRCLGHHAVPVGTVAFLVGRRWRDVTRRTSVIGEILQRPNYRTYFWLQWSFYVLGSVWLRAVDARRDAVHRRWPVSAGFYRYGGDRVDQYWTTDRRYVVGVTRKSEANSGAS